MEVESSAPGPDVATRFSGIVKHDKGGVFCCPAATPQVPKLQRLTRSTSGTHPGIPVAPPGLSRRGTRRGALRDPNGGTIGILLGQHGAPGGRESARTQTYPGLRQVRAREDARPPFVDFLVVAEQAGSRLSWWLIVDGQLAPTAARVFIPVGTLASAGSRWA